MLVFQEAQVQCQNYRLPNADKGKKGEEIPAATILRFLAGEEVTITIMPPK